MALNEVLNRPLFRQQALKKGALKPITAQQGIMVGAPTQDIRNVRFRPPAINQQGFFGRNIRPAMQRVRTGFPGFLRGAAAGTGLYNLSDALTTKLGITGPLKTGIDLGASIVGGFTPIGRAIGLGALGVQGLGALYDKIYRDNTGKERPTGTTFQNLTFTGGEPLANIDTTNIFGPVDPNRLTRKQRRDLKQKERLAKKEGSEVALIPPVKPDALVSQGKEEIGSGPNKTEVIDTQKVALENSQVEKTPEGGPEITPGEIKTKPDAPVEEVKPKQTAAQADLKLQEDTNVLDDDFKKTIAKARLIKEELMQGQTSNANLVFMAQLAQGLLSGTTRKQGLGGALEVFGNAIGPAMTNYATLKLKENELENNLMSDALELVNAENKSRNTAATLPKIKQFGVIQVQDANNQARNIVGVQYENGTFGVATGQFDTFGREIFAPIPANAVNKFIEHSKGQSERDKTIRDLSGKYKAYQIGLTSINLLKQADVTGGPKGYLALLSKRLSDALNDFGIGFLGREEGKAKIKQLKDQYIQQYMKDNDVDKDTATKVFEGQFGTGETYLRKTLKSLGAFKGEGADLEQLAINETILTYALANSLKSKDRLTQKDIQMAAKLVNVFPLLRGEASVIEALEAVNNTLIKDIQAAEFDYINAFGGDNRTIDNYRARYGIATTTQAPTITNPYADKSTQDLLKEY
tara:strand:+ start:2392 stop:4473 length:2082 start_codon:yes stop_codon:yes gene_type:complete